MPLEDYSINSEQFAADGDALHAAHMCDQFLASTCLVISLGLPLLILPSAWCFTLSPFLSFNHRFRICVRLAFHTLPMGRRYLLRGPAKRWAQEIAVERSSLLDLNSRNMVVYQR